MYLSIKQDAIFLADSHYNQKNRQFLLFLKKLENKERYQTVYAIKGQSVAAPTAGLHFTTELLEKIRAKGIEIVDVFLEVGLGTFRPVQVENVLEHKMHSEMYEMPEESAKVINKAKAEGRRVVAVGTTAIRTVESSAKGKGKVEASTGDTEIFIYPGYEFKIVDALITNFHLPKSTLLMLVSALAGKEFVFDAYKEAVEKEYKFFSFGDATYIYKKSIYIRSLNKWKMLKNLRKQ